MPHPGKWKVLRTSVEIKVPPGSPITREAFGRALRWVLEEAHCLLNRRVDAQPHTKPIVRWRRKP